MNQCYFVNQGYFEHDPDALIHLIHPTWKGLNESANFDNKNKCKKPDSSSAFFGRYDLCESVNQPEHDHRLIHQTVREGVIK